MAIKTHPVGKPFIKTNLIFQENGQYRGWVLRQGNTAIKTQKQCGYIITYMLCKRKTPNPERRFYIINIPAEVT